MGEVMNKKLIDAAIINLLDYKTQGNLESLNKATVFINQIKETENMWTNANAIISYTKSATY